MLPAKVTVKEVGPRDGLQNESIYVPTDIKVDLVNRLATTGLKHIEVSSFVHPKWVPSLADAMEVFARIERIPDVEYSALVPNERGLDNALAAHVDAVNVFLSASETHNLKNINKTIDATYAVLAPVVRRAKQHGMRVRGYVSTVFGCPYEGGVEVSQVVGVCERLRDLGVDEVSLGDTIGVAVPTQVWRMVAAISQVVPLSQIALHFHDTRGTALANVLAGLQSGITTFDASVGGLGGCPYAPGASGNVATEDLIYLLHGMGIDTTIDVEQLGGVASWFAGVIGKALPSHAQAVARSRRGGGHSAS